MFIPGKRVIGQYVHYESNDEIISSNYESIEREDVLNLIKDPILIANSEGTIIMVNDSFANIRGVSKEYLLGQNVKSFDPPSILCEVLRTKKAFRGLSHRDEDDYYVVDTFPIMNNDVLLGAIMMVKDISPIEQSLKLRNSQDNLEANQSYEFIGSDPSILNIKKMIKKLHNTEISVLITGETGTGKELFARYIHENSKRKMIDLVL